MKACYFLHTFEVYGIFFELKGLRKRQTAVPLIKQEHPLSLLTIKKSKRDHNFFFSRTIDWLIAYSMDETGVLRMHRLCARLQTLTPIFHTKLMMSNNILKAQLREHRGSSLLHCVITTTSDRASIARPFSLA